MSASEYTSNSDVLTAFQEYVDISNNKYYIVNGDLWTVSDILDYSGDKVAYVGNAPQHTMVLNRDIPKQRWLGTTVYPAQPTGLTTLVLVPNFTKVMPAITVGEKAIVDSWFTNYYRGINAKTKIIGPNAHGFLEWVNSKLNEEQATDTSFNTVGGVSVATDEAKKLLLMLQKAIQLGLLGRSDIAV